MYILGRPIAQGASGRAEAVSQLKMRMNNRQPIKPNILLPAVADYPNSLNTLVYSII